MTSSAPGAVVDTLRDVVPGVHMVTHGHTSCFVVEDADPDAGVTLVDAAYPSTWGAVRHCLAEIGRSAAEVRGLVLTHGHFDHLGFARELQRSYGVPVWAHAADAHLVIGVGHAEAVAAEDVHAVLLAERPDLAAVVDRELLGDDEDLAQVRLTRISSATPSRAPEGGR